MASCNWQEKFSLTRAVHGDVTVLIIAHRLSTVLLADRVMVLDAGKIEEIGKPKELLEDKTSYFYRLYHAQTID